jgi:hypothetical protein
MMKGAKKGFKVNFVASLNITYDAAETAAP